MNTQLPYKAACIALAVSLGGCASQSELTALRLNPDHPKYRSEACQSSIVSGGLLLPVLAANAGLDAADRIDASNMATRCGSRGESGSEIAGSVATGAVLGAATGLAPK